MARNKQIKNKKTNNFNRPNFWGFLQIVLLAALNKGQLFGMGIVVIFIIFAIKLPNNEIVPLMKNFLFISNNKSIFGWIFAIIITIVSFFVIRWQRKIHTEEIKRISQEKRSLQEKLINKQLPSSNKS